MITRWARIIGAVLIGTVPVAGAAAWGQTQPAQPGAPQQLRHHGGHAVVGTVSSATGATVVVTTRGGQSVTVQVTPATRILARQPATLGAFRPGDLVHVVAAKSADGSLTARAVVDSAAAMAPPGRPTPARSGIWAGRGDTVVLVGRLAGAPAGQSIAVTVPAGSPVSVTVPSTARLSQIASVPASRLSPGTRVAVRGQPGANGTMTATVILIAGPASR